MQENEKKAVALSEQGHLYGDKYAVADWLVAEARSCVLSTLRATGLSAEAEGRAAGHAAQRAAVLRLEGSLACSFVRKQEKRVTSDRKHVTEYVTGAFRGAFSSQSGYKSTEWVWKLRSAWALVLVCGADRHVSLFLLLSIGQSSLLVVVVSPCSCFRFDLALLCSCLTALCRCWSRGRGRERW